MNPKSDAWARATHAIAPQSEKLDREAIVRSFVDMGHLQLLRNQTSQYVEGRRGTGKTHLLSYFCEAINGDLETERAAALFVDARTLKLESAPEESTPRHHARVLYRELVLAVVKGLEEFAAGCLWQNEVPTARHPFEQRQAKQGRECLQELEKLVTLGLARPSAAAKRKDESDSQKQHGSSVEVGFGMPNEPGKMFDVKGMAKASVEEKATRRALLEQQFEYRVAYAEIGKKVERWLEINDLERVYLVIDEWSSIPRAAQPHLAEAIKRSFFPSPRIVLKLGTLPFQTRFGAVEDGQPVGFERNGDIFLWLDLDDDLVFVKNPERSLRLFQHLLHNHLSWALTRTGGPQKQIGETPEKTVEAFFTDKAFPRLLAYAHGNARDFLTLFRKSFLYFRDGKADQISSPHVDRAAKDFALEKLDGIKENAAAYACFNDIVSRVLHAQKSNGFLVDAELASNETLLFLVHNRVLHVWDRSYSSPNHAGKRFLVLSIDFCLLSEHLKAPNYRKIFESLPLPIGGGSAGAEKGETNGQRKLSALVAPDKRMVRYQVLPADFFDRASALKRCPTCDGNYSPTHPVAKKRGLCPLCGEPLTPAK